MSGTRDLYGYFNNHYHGYAPENCLDVLEMLGVETTEQKDMHRHIVDYRTGKAGARIVKKTLGDFFEQETEDIGTLILDHIDPSRLEKADEIKDIEIIELRNDRIVADVRGYSVYIDLEKSFILHDCPDWKRTSRKHRFCKHIGALILGLAEDRSRALLESLKNDEWEFSPYTGRGG